MLLLANTLPVSSPNSPPNNIPPAAKRLYVAKSPNVVGFSSGVMSGMASSRPLAKRTCVGFSDVRKAWNILARFARSLYAR